MTHWRADLHVHTVLSPCAGIEMIPPLIVEAARENGINLLAITDHNGSANVAAVMEAGRDEGITVLPGMELETAEEVHSLCLFDTLEQLEQLQSLVDRRLPAIANNDEFFGSQLVVDQHGNFIRKEQRLLLNAVDITIQEACRNVQELGGLFIPAHVEREENGLLSHLGTVPPDLPVSILEVSLRSTLKKALHRYPVLANYVLVQCGDVHYLSDPFHATSFVCDEPTVQNIARAIERSD